MRHTGLAIDAKKLLGLGARQEERALSGISLQGGTQLVDLPRGIGLAPRRRHRYLLG